MALKKYKPITPSRRYYTSSSFEELTTDKPHKSLTRAKKRTGGRNNKGRVTSRWIGGGHKKRYRIIDFVRRDKAGVPAKVATIEYDPNRSARIALLNYKDGEKRYILAPHKVKVGMVIQCGEGSEIRPGNALEIGKIPPGTLVHNIETKIGAGGNMIRSAGTAAQIVSRDSGYVLFKLPSGEIRKVRQECYATVGQVSNLEHENIKIGKAGRSRWLGKNPRVRGACMNPVDHPHGGGEGKSKGGRHPVTPWGVPTKGYKTRRNKRSDKLIVERKRKKK